jgi:hypothetical protein
MTAVPSPPVRSVSEILSMSCLYLLAGAIFRGGIPREGCPAAPRVDQATAHRVDDGVRDLAETPFTVETILSFTDTTRLLLSSDMGGPTFSDHHMTCD